MKILLTAKHKTGIDVRLLEPFQGRCVLALFEQVLGVQAVDVAQTPFQVVDLLGFG